MQATTTTHIPIYEHHSAMSPLFMLLNEFSMAFLLQAILAYPSPKPLFDRQINPVPDYVTKFGVQRLVFIKYTCNVYR